MSQRVGNSRFWNSLWEHYRVAPSIALCRVPELEYASTLEVGSRALDHCCGDGRFALLAWPDRKLAAGCDLSRQSIEKASLVKIYERLDICDVSQRLPYENESFDLVFNNSALEHITDLDNALAEITRVLSPGGTFAFNVLNHRYFEWWPLDETSKTAYRQWQPFYHALSLAEWQQHLADAGLQFVSAEGYFDRRAACQVALLDYMFSSVYLGHRRSRTVWWSRQIPWLMQGFWRWRLSSLQWKVEPDSGAGYFIKAVRSDA